MSLHDLTSMVQVMVVGHTTSIVGIGNWLNEVCTVYLVFCSSHNIRIQTLNLSASVFYSACWLVHMLTCLNEFLMSNSRHRFPLNNASCTHLQESLYLIFVLLFTIGNILTFIGFSYQIAYLDIR